MNNRELSVFFWTFIFVLVVFYLGLSKSKPREQLYGLFKMVFMEKLGIPIGIMLFYVLLLEVLYYKIGFWNKSLIIDSLYWVFGVCFVMFLNVDDVIHSDGYFLNVLKKNLTFIVILEFIVNFYAFHLLIELLLVPSITMLAMMLVVATNEDRFKPTKILIEYLMGFLGFCMFSYAFVKLILGFSDIVNVESFHKFLFPIYLTIGFLPFMYFWSLAVLYGNIFLRINVLNNNKALIQYAKKNILWSFTINLPKLRKFSRNSRIVHFDNMGEVDLFIEEFN